MCACDWEFHGSFNSLEKNIASSPGCRKITLFNENIGDSELDLVEVMLVKNQNKNA